MKNSRFTPLLSLLFGCFAIQIGAQTISVSNNPVVQPVSHRSVLFDVTDPGVAKPIIWGLDLAWLSKGNVQRGIAFMGIDNVDLIRSSFTPTAALVDGKLPTTELNRLKERLSIIKLTNPETKIVLNCDHPSVHSWYKGNAANWAELIAVTTKLHQEAGRTVVTVSPFNEPDYSYTGQGTINDFFNIAGELRKNPDFDNIRISGGNTLNCDQATPWYNTLRSRLDEGNTHQLAGSFDSYASFFTTVRANGHHATNDELHNVMEAMVGVEYGMQTGIWWGTAELARGEFVKASDGQRLAYAEHRPNWTAASVYRSPDGKIQAFGGTSERQAATTTYRFISKDRDVYYDGYGPQREYTMTLPGGTGYQVGQTNAETVVNVTWGDDIRPVINGRYILVNRNSGKILEVNGGSTSPGASIRQYNYTSGTHQQWDVTPVSTRIGGDFSYFIFTPAHANSLILDVKDWSLSNGGGIIVWNGDKGGNEQWYLDYAEDGYFYIRSRHSAKCLEVSNSSVTAGASILQRDKNGGKNQQWRFLPVGAPIEFNAPAAPANLTATGRAESILLEWNANAEEDLEGYTIFRAETAGGPYNTIARNVKTTSFVDNTATTTGKYFYAIRATDKSLNRSEYSYEASAETTGDPSIVARYEFEGNAKDTTLNLNHSALSAGANYVAGKTGDKALSLNGSNAFMQLPATVANQEEITIAVWVYWKGGSSWQRLFDFGNGEDQNMFLTPRSDLGKMRFAIKNGGEEQRLNAPVLGTNKWVHLTLTLSASGVRVWANGVQTAESTDITINPNDIKPVLNYIGRSQYTSDPYFNGYIDDLRIYNYALNANEIGILAGILPDKVEDLADSNSADQFSVWPSSGSDLLHISYSGSNDNGQSILSLYNAEGKLVLSQSVSYPYEAELNTSSLPAGMYTVKLTNRKESVAKEVLIKH